MRAGRMMMGVLYVVGGVGHFVATRMYVRLMPDYLPEHHALVLLSGAAEIAGGVGVMVGKVLEDGLAAVPGGDEGGVRVAAVEHLEVSLSGWASREFEIH